MNRKQLYEDLCKAIDSALNENFSTHDDDEHNIYDKLDDLDISYDFINDYDNIIEIDTPDDETRNTVKRLLNYYGWKVIKETKWSISAERIYGDNWNDYEDEGDDDEDYPYGTGIYYHVTLTSKVLKILRQGLTVREGNKLGYSRGERIYLLSYPSRNFVLDLFRGNANNQKTSYTILLVDIRKYLGNRINLYHDDFCADAGAVYTYDYIPVDCITVYDEFEL